MKNGFLFALRVLVAGRGANRQVAIGDLCPHVGVLLVFACLVGPASFGQTIIQTQFVAGSQTTFKSDSESGTDPNRILTNDLLQTSLSSATLAGTYSGSVGKLYDGQNGADSTVADVIWPGNDSVSSTWNVTFNLNTNVNTLGYNLTAISAYAAWADTRTDQRYGVQYQTIGDATWYGLTNVDFFLGSYGTGSSRTTIESSGGGYIATNVSALKFTVYYPHHANASTTIGFDATTYREIDVVGLPAAIPEPSALALVAFGLLGTLVINRRRRGH